MGGYDEAPGVDVERRGEEVAGRHPEGRTPVAVEAAAGRQPGVECVDGGEAGREEQDMHAAVAATLRGVAVNLGAQDEADAVQLQQAVRRLGERGAGLLEPHWVGEVRRRQQVDALGLGAAHEGGEVEGAAGADGEPGVGVEVRDVAHGEAPAWSDKLTTNETDSCSFRGPDLAMS